MRNPPTDIKLLRAERRLEITWQGNLPTRYDIFQVRCACCCARCVDERTGERILNEANVPSDLGITDLELVGNYAVRISFSDGHDTGIFTWDRLFELQPDASTGSKD